MSDNIRVWDKHGKETADGVFLGIEAEFSIKYADYLNIRAAKVIKEEHSLLGHFNAFKAKVPNIPYTTVDDGYGGGETGVELAFDPCSLTYLQKEKSAFELIFDEVNRLGMMSDRALYSGMHVHVTKSTYTAKDFVRLIKFFAKNEELCLFMSKRIPGHTFGQCATNVPNCDEDLFNGLYLEANKTWSIRSFYAICRKELPTIEYRCFQSTTNIQKFYANIEFIHSTVGFCKLDTLELDTYMNYVCMNKATYPSLYDYLLGFDGSSAEPKTTKQVAQLEMAG